MVGFELIALQWLAFALDISIKATLILALGGLLACRMRLPAAIRHRIWVAAFVAIAILPVLTLLLPGVAVPILPRHWSLNSLSQSIARSSVVPETSDLSQETVPLQSSGSGASKDAVAGASTEKGKHQFSNAAEASSSQEMPLDNADRTVLTNGISRVGANSLSLGSVLAAVWIFGAISTFIPLGMGLIYSSLFARTRERITDHALQQQLANLAAKLKIVRVPRLFLRDELQMPMIMGCVNPIVVLPSAAKTWNQKRTKSVLLHELAHIQRHDVLVQLAIRCVCCVYWFHPMVWWALGRVRLDREYACDDCALQSGCEATEYASELLSIAREYKSRSFYASVALSMARSSQLEGRLIAVLSAARMREAASSRASIATILSIACITVLLGVMRFENSASAQATANVDERYCVIEGIIRTEAREAAVGAKIECLVHDHPGGNYFTVPAEEKVERFETRADELGRFRLKVPRVVYRIPRMTTLIASAANEFPIVEQIDLRMPQNQVGLQFKKSKLVEIQIVGDTGPITGLSPRLESVQLTGGEFIASPHPLGHAVADSWPEVKEVKDGKYAVRLPALVQMFQVSINSLHHDAYLASVPVNEEPVQIKLESAHALVGTVEDQAGNPVENVKVVTADRFHREVRTDKNGKFRLVRGDSTRDASQLHFYPPEGSDLLYRVKEWYWRADPREIEETFVLKKGFVIEGRVIDKKTSQPIAEAQLSYEFDREQNEYARKNMSSNVAEMSPRYTSDQEGRFRIPVINGRGKLQVRQPNFDYKMVSKIQYPQMSGDAFRVLAYEKEFDIAQDSKIEPLTIELQQGERIKLQVQRPDGKVAKCMAMTPSYRFGEPGIPVMMPFDSIDGTVELPGAAVDGEVLLLDIQGQCGAVVRIPEHADAPIAIKLDPFSSAMIRIVGLQGRPSAGYRPSVFLRLRGVPASIADSENSALPTESIDWYSVINTQAASTNEQGIVKLEGLLPGVSYSLRYLDEHMKNAEQNIAVAKTKATD